jgi:hypothetical protein
MSKSSGTRQIFAKQNGDRNWSLQPADSRLFNFRCGKLGVVRCRYCIYFLLIYNSIDSSAIFIQISVIMQFW